MAPASTMGCGGQTPLTQHIAVNTMGNAAMCWVERVRPPQPEQIHSDGTLFLVRFVCTIIFEYFSGETMRDSSLARSLILQG